MNEPAPSAQAAAGRHAKVFISYAREDMAFADRLEAALKAHEFELLIDRTEIYAFEDWWKRIQALIAQADTVIFVLSPDAVASPVCEKEVAYAASLNKRFAPVVFRRVDDKLVPEALARLNFIFFDDEALFKDSLKRLSEALATDIDWIRKHTEYGGAARRWAAGGRRSGLLLRSPVLEEAERWIASRPPNAPAPTEETQVFVTESRRGATKRRNILTGSLAAGLLVALALAGLAYWQRGIALEQRRIADQQRDRAERTIALAYRTAHHLVFDLEQKLRDAVGVPAATTKDILDRARQLQDQLMGAGRIEAKSPPRSQGDALGELSTKLLAMRRVAQANPDNTDFQRRLSVLNSRFGDMLQAQGDRTGALAAYQESVEIRRKLAAQDQDNAERQSDLALSLYKLGTVADPPQARAALTEALSILEKLGREQKLTDDQKKWLNLTRTALSKLA